MSRQQMESGDRVIERFSDWASEPLGDLAIERLGDLLPALLWT
jgi:hypothetical protein